MTTLILGSNGLIGSQLQIYFKKNKIKFFLDTRNNKNSNNEVFYYDIRNYKALALTKKVKSIIYLSHIKTLDQFNIEIQIKALEFVLKLAKKMDIKFIFISSQSSLNSSLSRYGALKLAQSQIVIKNNGLSISIGLFVSDEQRGFFFLLKKLLINNYLKFKIYPDIPLETVTPTLLGNAILLALKKPVYGNFFLYNNQIRSFNELIDKLSKNKFFFTIYFPKIIVRFFTVLLNKIFKKFDFIESILSFINLKKFKINKSLNSFNKYL